MQCESTDGPRSFYRPTPPGAPVPNVNKHRPALRGEVTIAPARCRRGPRRGGLITRAVCPFLRASMPFSGKAKDGNGSAAGEDELAATTGQ